MRKRELVALLCLSSWCLMTVIVMWLVLMVPLIGLQCVTVVFPDYNHFFLMETVRSIHVFILPSFLAASS